MENEIKVGEYVRSLVNGGISKVLEVSDLLEEPNIKYYKTGKFTGFCSTELYNVKHSPNLIDLIQCGDYVNGKEVIMDLEKSKEWYKSKDDFITCKDYTFEENEIETIVTKEMMESISYKVTKM